MNLNRVRIYIATTEGPAEIQRLAEEDPEVRSVVCLNGTCEALPISPGYDAFVRKPTGVIERLFAHPVYRMDVSQRICEGRSWQLGALAAHALKAEGKLAGKDDQCEHILWITGEVDNELKVHAVEDVPEKLRQSNLLFKESVRQQQTLTLIVPAANRESIRDDQLPKSAEILPIENVAELFQRLRLETSINGPQSSLVPVTVENNVPVTTTSKRAKRSLMVAAGLAAAAVIAVSGFALHHSKQKVTPHAKPIGAEPVTIVAGVEMSELTLPELTLPILPPPKLTLYELRAPQGSNCAAVRFGKVDPVRKKIAPTAPKSYQSDRLDKLCGMTFRLVSPDKNAQLKLQTRFIKGDRYFEKSKLFALAPQIQQGPEANWRVIFPRRFRQGFEYEIILETNSRKLKPVLHLGN